MSNSQHWITRATVGCALAAALLAGVSACGSSTPGQGTAGADGAFQPNYGRHHLAGQLDATDSRLSERDERNDDSFFDSIAVDLHRGAEIQVWMRSSEVDPYLHLVGPDRLRVADHDDITEENHNAHLVYVAETEGRYEVIANSYGEGEVGEYTLEILTSRTPSGDPQSGNWPYQESETGNKRARHK